jgi:hypothetical protein
MGLVNHRRSYQVGGTERGPMNFVSLGFLHIVSPIVLFSIFSLPIFILMFLYSRLTSIARFFRVKFKTQGNGYGRSVLIYSWCHGFMPIHVLVHTVLLEKRSCVSKSSSFRIGPRLRSGSFVSCE